MDEHLADNGSLLPHLLMEACGRFIASHFSGLSDLPGDIPGKDEVCRVLDVLETAIVDGDEETKNAISVSFLENLWLEPYYPALEEIMGPALLADMETMMNWENPGD